MALGSIPAKARIRWVRLRISHPLPRPCVRVTMPAWPRQKAEGRAGSRRQGRLAAFQELTSERRRERELRLQREQLIHLARVGLLGELSAALVHELKQPLAAILVNAQAGRRCWKGTAHAQASVDEILEDIVDASQRAINVIQRMRELFLRRDAQRLTLDLNMVARDAVTLARSSMAEHGVRLELALDAHAVPLRGDPVQLQQVLLNLILNACDAMDANRAGMRQLALATAGGPGAEASLTVSDNGCGIASGLLERIFDAFFTTKPQGLGVGLSVSREIVAAHGGRIEAANRAEGGAVFRITLPIAEENSHG
jgi:C4-dicarboxylate-specific signal transduction histidine kinase